MRVPRRSPKLFSQLVIVLLCYTFIIPYFTLNSFHRVMAAPTESQVSMNTKNGEAFSMPQSGDGSEPTPGVPGPDLPNLDTVRQTPQAPPSAPPPIASSQLWLDGSQPCVSCDPGENTPPVALISYSAQSNQIISFDGSTSYDPDAGEVVTAHQWNFGDGTALASGPAITHTFSTPGTYTVRLTVTDSHTPHATGTTTIPLTISVQPATPTNAAEFVSQTVPTAMVAGQTYSVTVRMKNTGINSWTPATQYRLGSQNAPDNTVWMATNRVELTSSVAPGAEASFVFNVTAPATPGTYHFQWKMIQDGVGWFGNLSTDTSITVGVRQKAPYDFDGDGKTDIAVWRPSNGNWYIINSADNSTRVQYDWGRASLGDRLVPGDYDGDGKADLAVWRPTEGNYYIVQSSNGAIMRKGWGQSGDVPVPGDYDRDGKTDVAVFRPSEGNWYIIESLNPTNVRLQNWGASGDLPVPGDYDGDGRTDMAVWRPSEGNWYILNSDTNTAKYQGWGANGDLLVPGDYDGDGRTDIAVWRPSDGNFYLLNSATNTGISRGWGTTTDVPVPGDYDGDGKIDIAVWRPSEATWYIIQSSTNTGNNKYLGSLGDITVPSAYVRRTGNAAMFIEQSVPTTVRAGQQYNVTVRMRNTGTTTWTAASLHRLGSQSTPGSADWGITRATVLSDVVPGAEASFNLTVTAPSTAGAYNFSWRMVQDAGSEWFGDYTLAVPVTVTSGPGGTGEYIPTRVEMAMLSPRNRVGTSGVDLLSGNFNWSLPLLSLPGRAGHDLSLSISYNSLVWTKLGSSMHWDADHGFPSPGFHLGFPVIEPQFYNDQAQRNSYLMVMSSGARVELRETDTPGTYESVDSSYLQLNAGTSESLVLRTTDGTQLTYLLKNGAYRCTNVIDRNGNLISVSYHNNGRLEKITDTLARVITFDYDSNWHLTAIRQKLASGASRNWATFGYRSPNLVIETNFNGQTLEGVQNGQAITVLEWVGLADGSKYSFDYTTWGQVMKITTSNLDRPQRAYTAYNLPQDASGVGQSECPRFTERQDWAENFNYSGYQQQSSPVTTTFQFDGNGASGKATAPDGTVYKEYFATQGWQKGLTVKTENYATAAEAQSAMPKKWTALEWTQDNRTLTYAFNPRPVESNIYDADGNRRRSTIDYTAFGLPGDKFEYDATGQIVLRRAHTDYNLSAEYLNKRILGLPSAQYVFGRDTNATTEKLASKVTYQYDQGGEFMVAQGTPLQHDNQNYGTGAGAISARGLLTSLTRWDVTTPDDVSRSVTQRSGYNTTGLPVFSRDALGHQTNIGYGDSFSNSTPLNTFAYPTIVTDANGFSSIAKYDYDLGVVTVVVDPKGAEQRTAYDAAGRVQQVTNQTSGAYTKYVYGSYYVQSFSHLDTGMPDAYAITVFDGAGRVRATAAYHPGSQGEYKAQYIDYDSMGRLFRQSNPGEIDAGWNPQGDDVAGWLWSKQEYDWKGRPTLTTNTDATTRSVEYGGCGCAGGAVVTVTDEAGKKQKVYSDVLGRAWKTETLNSNGSIYAASVTVHNALDQVKTVMQYQGTATGDGSCPAGTCQQTTREYDGHGRIWKAHSPIMEASNFITYSYNLDDTVSLITDPRGATATFGYNNNRHLVNTITYGAPAGSNIPVPGPVSYEYDEAGNRTSMMSSQSSMTYQYNTLSRLMSETRTFTGLPASYTLTYDYTLAGQLKQMVDPFGGVLNYGVDYTGQLNNITGTGFGTTSQFVLDMKYRASGVLKEETYGNGFKAKAEYNARLQLKSFEVRAPDNQVKMARTHQYYSDGQLKASTNPLDERFDKAYAYDGIGRLAEAYTGSEARDFLSGTQSGIATGPYRQSYQYDAFNRFTGRESRFWSVNDVVVNLYANGRRQDLQYDAAGHVRQDEAATYTYDAAGRVVAITGETNNAVVTYDSDGRSTKYVNTKPNPLTGALQTKTFYYLRSTVLGGLAVAEINASGQKVRGYVYAGSRKLALTGAGTVSWEHSDPLTGSRGMSYSNGTPYQALAEYEPMGASIGFQDPFVNQPEEPLVDLVGPRLGQCSYSNPNCAACSIEGFSANCAEVNRLMDSGAAAQCENNDCRPQFRMRFNAFGEVITFLSTPYMAFANGIGGYFAPALMEAGTPQEQADDRALDAQQAAAGGNPTGLDRAHGQGVSLFTPQDTPRQEINDCLKFSYMVQDIANNARSVTEFLDKMASTFTAANNSTLQELNNNAPREVPRDRPQFGSSGFKEEFKGPGPQVRHFVGMFLIRTVGGPAAFFYLHSRETDPEDRKLNLEVKWFTETFIDGGLPPDFKSPDIGFFRSKFAQEIRKRICGIS